MIKRLYLEFCDKHYREGQGEQYVTPQAFDETWLVLASLPLTTGVKVRIVHPEDRRRDDCDWCELFPGK